MKMTAAAKVGFTAVILTLVIVGIYKGMGWRLPIPWLQQGAQGKYLIYVSFDNVKGLNPGAEVQLNGNPIGEVGTIVNDGYGGILVTLLIKTDLPIHEHARFVISRNNIFGGYMVSIDEARSAYVTVRNGEEIALRLGTGAVAQGVDVIKNNQLRGEANEVVGHVISVAPFSPTDSRSDRVVIRLDQGVVLGESVAFVAQRTLAGVSTIMVYDEIPEGITISGEREPGAEDLVTDADIALRDMSYQASAIMVEVSGLLEHVNELLAPEQVKEILDTLSSEASAVAQSILNLTNRLNSLLAESQPRITGTLENVEGLTSDARTTLQGFSQYSDPELIAQINDLVANLSEASERLNGILEDISQYTSDDEMRENVAGSIEEARAVLDSAQTAIESAQSMMGEASDAMDIATGIETGAEVTLRYSADPDQWTGGIDFSLGLEGSDAFVVAGMHDIGENERANAQVGLHLGDELSTRAGVHRGKLGFGLDWRSDAFRFMSDLYDPNDVQLDVYAGYAIMPEVDLLVGVEDLLQEDDVNFGLAFRF